MSKYQPLSEHLATRPGEEWRASFSDLEDVLGFALPKAARVTRVWWTHGPDKSHSRAWIEQGWRVADIDPAAARVVFRRGEALGAALAKAEVQPAVMREAAEAASARARAPRALGTAALVAGVAAIAALGAFLAGGLVRRR